MSPKPMAESALDKLIAIRREALAALRQDVVRLRQMQGEAEARFKAAEHLQSAFLEETRAAEGGAAALFVDRMQQRRQYLAHLEAQAAETADVVKTIAQQELQAHSAFEVCHKEIKALERLAERRASAARQHVQRLDYLRADDEELVRGQRGREAHDIGY